LNIFSHPSYEPSVFKFLKVRTHIVELSLGNRIIREVGHVLDCFVSIVGPLLEFNPGYREQESILFLFFKVKSVDEVPFKLERL
jgi:hypothetical protein